MSDGRRLYLAYRKRKEIFLKGNRNLAEAMEQGVAAWAIDYGTILQMRRKQVDFVGVWVQDERQFFVAPREMFMDERKAYRTNYAHKRGSPQQCLPLQHFMTKRVSSKV